METSGTPPECIWGEFRVDEESVASNLLRFSQEAVEQLAGSKLRVLAYCREEKRKCDKESKKPSEVKSDPC